MTETELSKISPWACPSLLVLQHTSQTLPVPHICPVTNRCHDGDINSTLYFTGHYVTAATCFNATDRAKLFLNIHHPEKLSVRTHTLKRQCSYANVDKRSLRAWKYGNVSTNNSNTICWWRAIKKVHCTDGVDAVLENERCFKQNDRHLVFMKSAKYHQISHHSISSWFEGSWMHCKNNRN